MPWTRSPARSGVFGANGDFAGKIGRFAVLRRELPGHLPFVIGLQVDEDGRLWVERWPRDGRSRFGVARDPLTDAQRIVVLRIPIREEE